MAKWHRCRHGGGQGDDAAYSPSAGGAITAVDGNGAGRRSGRAVLNDGPPVAVDLLRGLFGHSDGVGREHIVLIDAPGSAAVGLAEQLNYLKKNQVVQLRTAQRPGYEQTKEALVGNFVGKLGWYLPLGVDSVRRGRPPVRAEQAGGASSPPHPLPNPVEACSTRCSKALP